ILFVRAFLAIVEDPDGASRAERGPLLQEHHHGGDPSLHVARTTPIHLARANLRRLTFRTLDGVEVPYQRHGREILGSVLAPPRIADHRVADANDGAIATEAAAERLDVIRDRLLLRRLARYRA